MTNKFRGLEPLEVEAAQPTIRPMQMGLDGGYRGDVSPREVPPGSTPELVDVRFERRAIRKDFGWTSIGDAADNPVLVLLEHKYIDGGQTFQRLIRIWRNETENAVLEVWNGGSWVLVDTSVETINDVYLAGISALGCAYFADGKQVLEWCELLEKLPQENDFPSGNLLTIRGEVTAATISPGSAEPLEYTVTYDLTVNASPGQDTIVELEFFHGAVSLGTVEHGVSRFETFPFKLSDLQFKFHRVVADTEQISIQVKEAVGGGTTFELDNVITASGGAPEVEGDKTPATVPAVDDKYRYFFEVSGGETTVGFYYNRGAGWVLAAQGSFPDGAGDFTLTIPDFVEPDAQFGMGALAGGNIGDTQVGWTRSNADFELHGHNKETQGDDPAGVIYETTGDVISSFEKIDPGPGGRFLQFFARRLVVLRNFGDTQALTWSMDGILNNFQGAGSGESILVEARSDSVDDLMGTAVLGSNFMALFRKRSVWRVFETGNEQLALGAVSWIENLGTASPFSIQEVPGGAIFLGHDLMVYYITEQGVQPIGQPIHQELIETLTKNLDKVDSGWDPAFAEYYLGVPQDGGEGITKVWVFDLGRFIKQQEFVWRPRAMNVQRFGVSSEIERNPPLTSGALIEPEDGIFYGYTDFSEFDVQAPPVEGLTLYQSTPAWEIRDDADEFGHYLYAPGSQSPWAIGIDAFDDVFTFGEILSKIYLDTRTASGARVKGGPGAFKHTDASPTNPVEAASWVRLRTFNNSPISDSSYGMGQTENGANAISHGTNFDPLPTYLWIRLRLDDAGGGDTRFRRKVWKGTLEDEPVAWASDETLTPNFQDVNHLGFIRNSVGPEQASERRMAYFAFSTDPDNYPPPEETDI